MPLRPRNSVRVAAYRPGRFVHIEKGSPVGELGIVGVPREKRSAHRIDFGDHMPIFFLPLLNIYVIK